MFQETQDETRTKVTAVGIRRVYYFEQLSIRVARTC